MSNMNSADTFPFDPSIPSVPRCVETAPLPQRRSPLCSTTRHLSASCHDIDSEREGRNVPAPDIIPLVNPIPPVTPVLTNAPLKTTHYEPPTPPAPPTQHPTPTPVLNGALLDGPLVEPAPLIPSPNPTNEPPIPTQALKTAHHVLPIPPAPPVPPAQHTTPTPALTDAILTNPPVLTAS